MNSSGMLHAGISTVCLPAGRLHRKYLDMKPAGRFDSVYVERATGNADWSYYLASRTGFNQGPDPRTSSSGGPARLGSTPLWLCVPPPDPWAVPRLD